MPVRTLKIHMPTVYGSSYEDMGKRVRDKYTTGTEQTKLQWAWLRLKNLMSIEQFRALDVTFAEAMDAAWSFESPGNLLSGFQNTYTKVILPAGRFLQNCNGNIARGGMIGEGSFGYGGNGADHGQTATEFEMRPDEWIGPGEQRMWSTPNASLSDNSAYNESFELQGIRLTMPIDNVTRVGWYIKRAGSTSYGNMLQANGGSKGFVFVDGVPAVFGTIRAFNSGVAGVSFEGTWGADITITKLECDGCARAFQVINSADGNGGGVIRIGLKLEDGVTNGIPWPGSYVYIEGQYDIDVTLNASFKNNVKPSSGYLFVINPKISTGEPQASRLEVSGKGFGYGKLMKNAATGKEWNGPGEYAAYKFEHYAANDTLYSNCPTLAGATPTTPTDPTTPPTGSNIDRTGWKASGTVQTTAKPASLAIDGSTSTFCETGRPHVVGDYIEIDMQTTRSLGGVTILYQPYGNAWPNKVELFTSLTGAANSWTSRGVFQGSATCTMTLPTKVNCRYFKAVTKELIPNVGGPWCAISDVSAKG